MKKVYFILMLFIFPSVLHANACDGVKNEAEIIFYSSYGDLNYDLTRSKEYLSNLATQSGIHEGFVAGGLAVASLELSISLVSSTQYTDPNDACVIPKKVNVFIGYQKPTIYVANHLERESCRFFVTLRHEQAHMQINKKALEYFLPHFKVALNDITSLVKPINVTDINDINKATENLNQQYYDEIMPLVKRFNEILSDEQMKLDVQSNYDYEKTLCK
ncbi:MAG: hypothetical protein R3Y43_01135 [Alphaproteobacteria bacterium]